MLRLPQGFLVAFLTLASAAHALQFSPATPMGLPAFPQVTAVAVSAAEPQVVYAVAGGWLFRSTDAGANWIALAVPAPIDRLTIDPANSAILYVVSQMRLYRSDDSGTTWQPLASVGAEFNGPVQVNPQDPSTLYVRARCSAFADPREGGVYKSSDRGVTWSLLSTSLKCVNSLAIDPVAPSRLFASTWSGQYRTDDASRTWRPMSGEVPAFAVIADPVEPSRRYGLGHGPSGDVNVHFLVSNDAGTSWTRLPAAGLPPGGQQLVIDPVTRRFFLLGQSFGLYVSDDLGLTWRRIDAVPALVATPLTMAAAGDVLYVATSRGLYRVPMNDPDKPSVIHLGEPAPLRVTVTRIATDPTDPSVVYATAYEGHGILNAHRVFRSTDAGRTWERITADEDIVRRQALAVDAAGDLYAADIHVLWRFSKASQTWETWAVPELYTPSVFLANPKRPGWLYTANTGGALLSTDGGRTWSRMNIAGGFWSLDIAPNGSDLVGGNNEGVFASNDGGVTWRSLHSARLETRQVAIAPSRPETIYRLSNTAAGMLLSGLFRSDDGGETWTALRWPGERDTALQIAVDPRDHRSVWIGLAHSTDGGETWTIEPSNVPVPLFSVAFNRDGTVFYGIARDSSVWRSVMRASRRRAAGS